MYRFAIVIFAISISSIIAAPTGVIPNPTDLVLGRVKLLKNNAGTEAFAEVDRLAKSDSSKSQVAKDILAGGQITAKGTQKAEYSNIMSAEYSKHRPAVGWNRLSSVPVPEFSPLKWRLDALDEAANKKARIAHYVQDAELPNVVRLAPGKVPRPFDPIDVDEMEPGPLLGSHIDDKMFLRGTGVNLDNVKLRDVPHRLGIPTGDPVKPLDRIGGPKTRTRIL
ncbi:hypothetical protein FRB97_000598 [Tulasnella sp. 331]|nr:hypothetical protein FRB97_000598 [Tulasnella sp. 331]